MQSDCPSLVTVVCVCARTPKQSQMSVHKLVAERLHSELQLYSWEIKVSVISLRNLVRLKPVSPLIQKIILQLQIYTNTIKIRSELQATFKNRK